MKCLYPDCVLLAGSTQCADVDGVVRDVPDVDILFAGFPCQDVSFLNSNASKSRAEVLSGNLRTGTVFKDGVVQFAKHHRPKVMILENVMGLAATARRPAVSIGLGGANCA